MPQKERLRVWNGELKKTAGGLTRKDLMKNSRGKIVSRKKSGAASKENNLGKWLRKKGDSFSGKLVEAGLPAVAGKGAAAKKPKPKPPKAPKPKVDKKIAAAAAAPKPKPKPVAKPKPKPKPVAKPKPKPKPKSPKPKPKPKLRTSPIKAGEVKNYANISVGNIITKKAGADQGTKHWPAWAKKQTSWLAKQKIKKAIRDAKGAQNVDWEDLLDDMEDDSWFIA